MSRIEIKAQRAVSIGADDGFIIVAFKPSKSTIKQIKEAEGSLIIVDLVDETGHWSNDRTVEVAEVEVSDDGKVLQLKLLT